MADKYLVPQRLDDPELIGFWTIVELAGLLVLFAWGILAQHIIIGTALSGLTWFALRKAKASGAGSKLVHAAYWYLPGSLRWEKESIATNRSTGSISTPTTSVNML